MINIAIVEDEDKEAAKLAACLEQYRQKYNKQFSITRYRDALKLLEDKTVYDIIFMDIMLPIINGMEAAKRLRRYNTTTVLIFVTNMTQFAIKSYEVDALDYILKPISYERVTLKLNKAIDVIHSSEDTVVVIKESDGIAQISSNDIHYIEVRGHKLQYHTVKGIFTEYRTLSEIEEVLKNNGFLRCNSCYLVNLRSVFSVRGLSVLMVNGDELKISQPKRKEFLNGFTNWRGQGK